MFSIVSSSLSCARAVLSFLSERLSRGRKLLTLARQYPEVVLRYVVFVSHEQERGVMMMMRMMILIIIDCLSFLVTFGFVLISSSPDRWF